MKKRNGNLSDYFSYPADDGSEKKAQEPGGGGGACEKKMVLHNNQKKKKKKVAAGAGAKQQPENSLLAKQEEEEVTVEVTAIEVQGIIYCVDGYGNAYEVEDILRKTPNPRIIARFADIQRRTIIEEDLLRVVNEEEVGVGNKDEEEGEKEEEEEEEEEEQRYVGSLLYM